MLADKRILIMGLLDTQSIAWAVGSRAQELGAQVTYTVQSERFRDVLLRRSFKKQELDIDDYNILACDVTNQEDIKKLFASCPDPIHGLVHSIAYANAKTCLTNNMFDATSDDVKQAFEISAASLALILKEGQHRLADGGSVVALSFNTLTSFPGYDWMGVCKSALESVMRYLARDLGKRNIRVNCVSSGPLHTKAATSIPGFDKIRDAWSQHAPLRWNPEEDHIAVADAIAFLLSDMARKITGDLLYVDGGFHANRSV